MELLIALVATIVIGILAQAVGADSRELDPRSPLYTW
jgi:hypothetical protein